MEFFVPMGVERGLGLERMRFKTAMETEELWTITPRDIRYEDASIIVVEKPYGLPSQPTLDPKRDNAYAAVMRYCEKSNAASQDGGGVYVALHHRLDALTSGILVLSKSKVANPSLSEQFQKHTIRKAYVAVCAMPAAVCEKYRTPGTTWLIDAPIGEARSDAVTSSSKRDDRRQYPERPSTARGAKKSPKVQMFSTTGVNRKTAKTLVTCEQIAPFREGYIGVYRCEPITGRTHQIRVHLSSSELYIIGDPLYGVKFRSLQSISPGRMCLHAEAITFNHPITNEALTVTSPRPTAFAQFMAKVEKMARASGIVER